MSKKVGLAICRREGEAHLASSTVTKTGEVGGGNVQEYGEGEGVCLQDPPLSPKMK